MSEGESQPCLNLLVIRSADIDRAKLFYELIGLAFERERHGNGPEHFAAVMAGCVIEIYPGQHSTDDPPAERLGFSVSGVDEVIPRFRDAGHTIQSEPRDSPWGRRAVVVDPDGRKVELTEARS